MSILILRTPFIVDSFADSFYLNIFWFLIPLQPYRYFKVALFGVSFFNFIPPILNIGPIYSIDHSLLPQFFPPFPYSRMARLPRYFL